MKEEKLLFSFTTKPSLYNFQVVSFKGYQEIGELYRYEIDLISEEKEIDFDKMLTIDVCLKLHNEENGYVYVHGVLEYFEAHQKIDDFIYYKACLVPKLWWLTLAQNQKIFLDKKIPDVIEGILKEGKLTSNDYVFKLHGNYDKKEYVCQYKESRYDFIKRWMEREGIYFYFDSDENGCKLVITDVKDTQTFITHNRNVRYKPSSGLQGYEEQAVSSIVYRSNNTVKSVRMKNYSYEKPASNINVVTDTSVQDYAQTYLYGYNLKSQEEAKRVSKIKEEKYNCLNKEMHGESNIVSLVAGKLYTLKNYFKEDLNDDYLMVRVECEGSQRGFLTTAFNREEDNSNYYTNTFLMIPSKTQYRMQTAPQWPYIGGTISAVIDAQGSGDTAELDKYGRYKVIMPFDLSGRGNAKASAYLRMAQPSAGKKQGIHFPLHKGTEVLIGFKGGDPDQPVIMGAIPNSDTPSPVNENNVTKNIIQTHGGNVISMEDAPGKAHIKMGIHDDLCTMVMHNDDGDDNGGEYGIAWKTGGFWKVGSLDFANTIGGNKEELVIGTTEDVKVGAALEVFVGAKAEYTGAELLEIFQGGEKRITPETKKLEAVSQTVGVIEKEVQETKQTNITNIQQTVVEKVEITEDMIADYVKNIVTGMNLTEALKQKISTMEKNVITVEDMIQIGGNLLDEIEERVEKVNSSFKEVQFESRKIAAILSQAKFKSDGAEMREMAAKIATSKNELTIFQ